MPPPLANVLADVKRSFEAKLYYPALVVALTLPEICASTLLKPEEFVRQQHYVGFLDQFADTEKLGVDALTCYRLRGGVIHRGDASGHPLIMVAGEPVENVIFTVPETGVGLHGVSISVQGRIAVALMLDVFLGEMDAAVRRWYEAHNENDEVISRLWQMLSWRPEGVPGYVEGAPLIASGPENSQPIPH